MLTSLADIRLALNALGNSADQVAASLKAQGIKGVRNTARFLNPICRFLEVAFSLDLLSVDLLNHDAFRISYSDGTKLEGPLPRAIIEFLGAFNRGAYPDIERPVT